MIFKNNNSHKVGTDQNNKGRKDYNFCFGGKYDQSLEENNDENKKSSTKTINGLR